MRVERHSAPRYAGMSFGCLNIRSLGNKLDDLLEVRHDRQIDVMFLTETWHDSDSVSLSLVSRVLDRGIVTMEDEYKVVCALSNSFTFDDLE